ncbi:MAG TPA: hypothetical protein VHE78_01940 [Gemmatimonadaceae bacterium]|nr:hypothetical protein [Gemmatimonadaceae bacterium]
MQRTIRTLLAVGLLTGSVAATALSQDAAKANTTLLNATGPFEDMVEPAIAKDDKGVAKQLAAADKAADGIRKALPTDAARRFDGLLQSIHKSADAKDGLAVARNAMVVFRLLVDNLKADILKIPLEVNLMDYAGYQFLVLAAADTPDWDAMSKLAADADGWWKSIARKVTAVDLRGAINRTMVGLKQSAQEKNLSMAKFAAHMDLDLVDVLEGTFTKK